MFTGRQQGFYRMLVEKAWRAHCAREKIHPDSRFAKDEWYRCVLLDACGVYTTKEANNTTDFDCLMLAFAGIAGDDYWIKRMAGATERRWKWLISQKMSSRGMSLGGNDKAGEHYIEAIMRHMHLDQLNYRDLPAEHLQKIFIALDEDYKRHHRHDRELGVPA